jgi:putative membrane protein
MFKTLRVLAGVTILIGTAAGGALFALQNTAAVPLDLLFIQLPERSVAVWLLAFFMAGAFLGLLTSSYLIVRAKTRLASTKRQIKRLSLELDRLRKVGFSESE